MEVTQFTYFQQLGGIDLDPIPAEMTYGLERLGLYLQGKQRLRPRLGAGRHLGRRLPGERAAVVAVQLRGGARRRAPAALRRARGGGRSCSSGGAAAGLRPGAEVLARVQPARRARGGLGDGARRLHRPCPRPRAHASRSSTARRGRRWRRAWSRSAARSCPRSRVARPPRQLPELARLVSASAEPILVCAAAARACWPRTSRARPQAELDREGAARDDGPAAGREGVCPPARARGRRSSSATGSCGVAVRRQAAAEAAGRARRGDRPGARRSARRCSGARAALRFPRPVRWLLAKRDSDDGRRVDSSRPAGHIGHRFHAGRDRDPGRRAYLGLLRNADVEPDADERAARSARARCDSAAGAIRGASARRSRLHGRVAARAARRSSTSGSSSSRGG